MLSGAKDEIVPKEHMRRLWEVVAKRGEKRRLNGSEYKTEQNTSNLKVGIVVC